MGLAGSLVGGAILHDANLTPDAIATNGALVEAGEGLFALIDPFNVRNCPWEQVLEGLALAHAPEPMPSRWPSLTAATTGPSTFHRPSGSVASVAFAMGASTSLPTRPRALRVRSRAYSTGSVGLASRPDRCHQELGELWCHLEGICPERTYPPPLTMAAWPRPR